MKEKLIIIRIKGGLGNQLNQYATALSLAYKYNGRIKLELSFFDIEEHASDFGLKYLNFNYDVSNQREISKLVAFKQGRANSLEKLVYGIKNQYFKKIKKTFIEDGFGYKPSRSILDAKPPVFIDGWCQKEAYFHSIRNQLKIIYKPKRELSGSAKKYLKTIKSTNSVSIHIRRGDYLKNNTFKTLSLSYYKKGIEIIKQNVVQPEFYLFSDDLEWVKQKFSWLSNSTIVEIIEDEGKGNPVFIEDFTLMKYCKFNIIANSSFSWWASYLNENHSNLVLSPKIWFDDVQYQQSWSNNLVNQDNWIIVG
jgi:hypothetical protein